jgi:hypothetical protein
VFIGGVMPKEVIDVWNQALSVRWGKGSDGVSLELIHDEPFVFVKELKKGKVKKKTDRYASLVITLDKDELDGLVKHLKRAQKQAFK